MQWRWHREAKWRGANDANTMEVTMRGKVERCKVVNDANAMKVTMKGKAERRK